MGKLKFFFVIFLSWFSLHSQEKSAALEAGPEGVFHELLYNKGGDNLIGYLSIEREHPIDDSTYIYVKFAIQKFLKKGVKFIVLDLDTAGGKLAAALNIAYLLIKVQSEKGIPVIAFINNWALSEGAMLAYASKYIATINTSLMGASENVKGSEIKKYVVKIDPIALQSEFSSLAIFFGRDPLIAKAMVDKEIIVVRRGDAIIALNNENKIRKSDEILSKKGQLLTLNSQELIELGVADVQVSIKSLPSITQKEMRAQKWPASKNLLFQSPPLNQISQDYLIGYKSWRISFFSFLTMPIIAAILFFGFILGLYVQICTLRFSIPGLIGFLCLALMLISNYFVYVLDWLEITVFLVGVFLILFELFIIPGFAIIGVLGVVLTLIGSIALLLPLKAVDMLSFNFSPLIIKDLIHRLIYLGVSFFFSLIAIASIARFFRDPLVLFRKLEPEIPQVAKEETMPVIGTMGKAITSLTPAGKVEIDGIPFDVISEGSFIKKGDIIKVLRIEDQKIVVIKA